MPRPTALGPSPARCSTSGAAMARSSRMWPPRPRATMWASTCPPSWSRVPAARTPPRALSGAASARGPNGLAHRVARASYSTALSNSSQTRKRRLRSRPRTLRQRAASWSRTCTAPSLCAQSTRAIGRSLSPRCQAGQSSSISAHSSGYASPRTTRARRAQAKISTSSSCARSSLSQVGSRGGHSLPCQRCTRSRRWTLHQTRADARR
mmetsp:Transcript_20211/g.62844  ORF Transcript_20211/g.62844 Transcript_20211/m.62844 type:complete len:208 (-) Transcript_20211:35-658(-)